MQGFGLCSCSVDSFVKSSLLVRDDAVDLNGPVDRRTGPAAPEGRNRISTS